MTEGNGTTSQNKETARRYYAEVWAKGDSTQIDEFLTDDYLDHNPFPGLGADRAGAAAMVTAVMADTSDVAMAVGHVIAEGDFVAAHWRMDWTQHGRFMGTNPSRRPTLVARGPRLHALCRRPDRRDLAC